MNPHNNNNNILHSNTNRSSVAGNFSNFKYNNFSHRGESTNSKKGSLAFKGVTNFGHLSKQLDSRPLIEKFFQKECNDKVVHFLTTNNYEFTLPNGKMISDLGKTDFIRIFTFIIKLIREDCDVIINKLEDDVPKILADFFYPNTISKHTLIAIGAPNSNGQIIAMLHWLVEYAECVLGITDKLNNKEKKDEEHEYSDKSQITAIDKDFLVNSYHEIIKTGKNSNSLEVLKNKLDSEMDTKLKTVSELENEIKEYSSEKLKIQATLDSFKEIDINVNRKENDLNDIQAKILNIEVANSSTTNQINSLQNELKQLIKKKDELTLEEEKQNSIIANQPMSKLEYDGLKNKEFNNNKLISSYEKNYLNLSEKAKNNKKEVLDSLNNAYNAIKSYFALFDKYNVKYDYYSDFYQLKLNFETILNEIDYENEISIENFKSIYITKLEEANYYIETSLIENIFQTTLELEGNAENLNSQNTSLKKSFKILEEEILKHKNKYDEMVYSKQNLNIEYEALLSNLDTNKGMNSKELEKLNKETQINQTIINGLTNNLKNIEQEIEVNSSFISELNSKFQLLKTESVKNIQEAEEKLLTCTHEVIALKERVVNSLRSLNSHYDKIIKKNKEIMENDLETLRKQLFEGEEEMI